MILLRRTAPAVLMVFLAGSCSAAAIDCMALYRDHLASDLDLSYEEFDQTEDRGFRVLAKDCQAQAADLIEAYIVKHGRSKKSLTWHVAQMRAESGETQAAIAAARSVLDPEEAAAKNPFKWNEYVLAIIAFLEKDRQHFDLHRNALAESATNDKGNALNLRLVDRLGAHFDATYSQALAASGKPLALAEED